jgi:hypothetical protein
MGLVLAACANQPAPAAWAASVCTALTPWRSEISSLTERTERQMNGATTPAQAKENLVRLLRGAEDASETARARVAAAGVPDVDNGEEISRSFVQSLTGARDAYRRARVAVEAVAVNDPSAFYGEVEATMKTLNEEYGRSALDTTKMHSVQLRQAFDEVPECR